MPKHHDPCEPYTLVDPAPGSCTPRRLYGQLRPDGVNGVPAQGSGGAAEYVLYDPAPGSFVPRRLYGDPEGLESAKVPPVALSVSSRGPRTVLLAAYRLARLDWNTTYTSPFAAPRDENYSQLFVTPELIA